ncbi:hypothetical protein MUP59_05825 [Candidatus Bathyarchaeota archaeon]|nr:hypothetical protein [Candidatus Bathyarchaeota archaeon]
MILIRVLKDFNTGMFTCSQLCIREEVLPGDTVDDLLDAALQFDGHGWRVVTEWATGEDRLDIEGPEGEYGHIWIVDHVEPQKDDINNGAIHAGIAACSLSAFRWLHQNGYLKESYYV